MPVVKATITLTILAEIDDEDDLDNFTVSLGEMSAEDIEAETLNGDWIGQMSVKGVVIVPPDALEQELLEIGNDGSFFEADKFKEE